MDEKTAQTPNVESQPQAAPAVVKPVSGNRNLMLAIGALIIGAVVIAGIFVFAYPKQTEAPVTTTSQTKQVIDITKTSDLNTASSELDSTNLDGYQSDLNQISASATSF